MSRQETSHTFPLDEPEESEVDHDFEDPAPCKRCRSDVSQACGSSCIAIDRECTAAPGCACQG